MFDFLFRRKKRPERQPKTAKSGLEREITTFLETARKRSLNSYRDYQALEKEFFDRPDPERAELAVTLLGLLADSDNHHHAHYFKSMLSSLLSEPPPLPEQLFTTFCGQLPHLPDHYRRELETEIVRVIAAYKKTNDQFSEQQTTLLAKVSERWMRAGDKAAAKAGGKIAELIDAAPEVPWIRMMRNGEAIAHVILDDLEAMPQAQRDAWAHLLAVAINCNGSKPNKKWQRQAADQLATVGESAFAEALIHWLPAIDKPAVNRQSRYDAPAFYNFDPDSFCNPHMDTLKGLAWMSGFVDNNNLARAIGTAGISAFKKIPGTGPRAVRLGNACIWALGNLATETAMAQLAIMKVRVKSGSAQKSIQKALSRVADQRGVSSDELEEICVPTYGLTEVGHREDTFGDYKVILELGPKRPQLRYLRPDGKEQKTVPTAIKNDYADQLKELKAAAKDIEKMLTAQRERLDNLFLQRHTWQYGPWRERYLDHPLVGALARNLIWSIDDTEVIWHNNQLTTLEGTAVSPTPDAQVKIWHPIDAKTATIVAWRNWLFEHLVQQPFKQAHREIYLLTDAERTTNTYSNRFAAHVLKQHQFNSLCRARGWKNSLRLMVDDEYPPASKPLPQWGLRAEYWVEGIGDDHSADYVNESGTFLYLATDQVRFYRLEDAQATAHAYGGGYGTGWQARALDDPIPLDEIPPLVFSEVMRDVDLFVGVSSVGNDPDWRDGGPQARHDDYWRAFAFGELGESAAARKELLAQLLPRLKIAQQCQLDGRYLVVTGKRRTYKIHLGSGNILMTPNDQYLCIVKAPSRTKSDKVFLPFAGDGKLATILSKAFLLAADDKITDPTINSQINRR